MTVTAECKEDLFCGVNTVEDMDNMSDLEKKHFPVISAPKNVKSGEPFEVTVEVGKYMEHPAKPAHHIEFIELYAGHTYLARIDMTEKITPVMKVQVTLDHGHGNLRAFEHCNMHGTWEGTAEIEVSQ